MRIIAAVALCLGALVGALSQPAGAGEKAAQTICPITGTRLAKAKAPMEVHANGFRFLVADAASAELATRDPAKAFAALAKNKEAAEPISQACPVMGNRINPGLFVQKNGYRVYMCCRGCTKRVQNNWDQTLRKLAEQAEQGDAENLPTM